VTFRFHLATGNPDKVAEIRAILVEALGPDVELVADDSGVEETGATLEENARLKAGTICDLRGEPALADDTGLEVDVLRGAPGVRSARFAGPHATYADNVAKLLDELAGCDPSRRTARFVTVAIARFPDGEEVLARGAVEGAITDRPRGEGGFGYDPVFVPDEGDGRTFAEMSAHEKHALSHRGRAFRALAALLAARAAGQPDLEA
jgi:XTP/dITP diphosphohydrolase